MSSEEDGLVIFDGGTYSRGPSSLIAAEEEFGGADSDGVEALEADKERLERQLQLEVTPLCRWPWLCLHFMNWKRGETLCKFHSWERVRTVWADCYHSALGRHL